MTWRGETVAMLPGAPTRPGDHQEIRDVHRIAEPDGEAQTEPLQGEPRHEIEQAHAEDARGKYLDEGLDHVATVVRVEDDHDGQAIDGVSHQEARPLGTEEMSEPGHREHGDHG